MGWFDKLKRGLQRTTQQLLDRFDSAAPSATGGPSVRRALTLESLDALEEALVGADVGLAAAERIVAAVRARARRGDDLGALVKEEILRILEDVRRVAPSTARPHVVMIVGVNGTGKTTTVGKLAHGLRMEGRQPLICAADTFRAAAVEQLEVWAARAHVDMVRARQGADPAAVVFDAVTSAKARERDVLLIDTAGRLHTRANLMQELAKIRRIIAREVDGAPHEVLLVLDATVGQNGLVQAREFTDVAGVNGIVLTKLDGTAKGGIAVAIAQELRLPIRYVGVGETIDDLIPFVPREYVDALFEDKW
ncbi:MAG: signal recognition particle-docking protein FtsY [Vicinamibacterales bacterium]